MEFKVCSSAFNEGEFLPEWYSGSGLNASPPIGWDGEPEGTVSLALICTSSRNKVHWLMWNIPNTLKTVYGKLPRDSVLEDGSRQGLNDFGEIGWTGPQGNSEDLRLKITLYALDRRLDISGSAIKAADLTVAMKGHVLREACLGCVCP